MRVVGCRFKFSQFLSKMLKKVFCCEINKGILYSCMVTKCQQQITSKTIQSSFNPTVLKYSAQTKTQQKTFCEQKLFMMIVYNIKTIKIKGKN